MKQLALMLALGLISSVLSASGEDIEHVPAGTNEIVCHSGSNPVEAANHLNEFLNRGYKDERSRYFAVNSASPVTVNIATKQNDARITRVFDGLHIAISAPAFIKDENNRNYAACVTITALKRD